LSKNPEERYPSCRAFVQALQGTYDEQADKQKQRGPERAPSSPGPDETDREEAHDTEHLPPVESGHESQLPMETGGVSERRRIRPLADVAFKEEPSTKPPVKQEEVRGDGILFPALVLGLGRHGLGILQRLRHKVQEQFGALDALPNLRMIYVDTDVESARAAANRFHPSELLLTRINRPRHYLRSQTGRPNIDTWFDLKMLYRIPRNLVTRGMRALGRLAFVDNYRQITRRLKNELQACTDPECLAAAAGETGLGMRTNQPRVYVL